MLRAEAKANQLLERRRGGTGGVEHTSKVQVGGGTEESVERNVCMGQVAGGAGEASVEWNIGKVQLAGGTGKRKGDDPGAAWPRRIAFTEKKGDQRPGGVQVLR
eukprot:85767-Chlamydomonas_euryale.AAC.4